jgi:hypothetical protein
MFILTSKALYKAQIVKMGENVGIDFQFFENTRDEPSTSILNNVSFFCFFL